MIEEFSFQLVTYDTDVFDKTKWIEIWEDAWPTIHTLHRGVNSAREYIEKQEQGNQLFNPEEQIQSGFKKIFLLVPVV